MNLHGRCVVVLTILALGAVRLYGAGGVAAADVWVPVTEQAALGFDAEGRKVLRVTGLGSLDLTFYPQPPDEQPPGYTRRQSAFVAALFDAVRQTMAALPSFSLERRTVPGVPGRTITDLRGSLGEIAMEAQTVKDRHITIGDMIMAAYRGQKVMIADGLLVYPPVAFVDLPSWDQIGERFGAFQVQRVHFEDDGHCTVTVTYRVEGALREEGFPSRP